MPRRVPVRWRSSKLDSACIIRAQPTSAKDFDVTVANRLKVLSILILVTLLGGFLAGCSAASASSQDELKMAPMDGMAAEIKSAPLVVRQSYQFAAANPDILKHIPCYCGCDDIGHTSNYSCYVTSVDQDGHITYDTHALGCSICVDITQDVMRLLKQGKTVPEIKTYIDQTYSQYGPSNMP